MTKDTNKVKGFFIYFEQCDALECMPNEACGELLKAMAARYQGKDFEFSSPLVESLFRMFEKTFTRDAEKYQKICDSNKAKAEKRWNKDNATACHCMPLHNSVMHSNAEEYRTDTENANINININNNNNIKNTSYSLSASDADVTQNSLLDEKASREVKGIADCPHQQIIDLYHECLPELRRVKRWTGKRASHLKARWRENWDRYNFNDSSRAPSVEGGLDYWKRFFTWVHGMDFLMGKVNDFQADLEWIIKPSNFTNITEKKYLNRA